MDNAVLSSRMQQDFTKAVNTFGTSKFDCKVPLRIFSDVLEGLIESDLLHHGRAAP